MGAKIITRNTPLGFKQNPQIVSEPKFNPEKSHAEFPSHKNFQKALNDITRKIETLVLNTQKNTCPNFPTQKNPEIENFKPQKILRSSLSHEIQNTPMGFLGDANQKSIVPDLAVLLLLLFFYVVYCYFFFSPLFRNVLLENLSPPSKASCLF